MNNYKRLMRKFKEEEPFALVRFNDGEMQGIQSTGVVVARGDQRVSKSLHNNLLRALQHRQGDYWIGKPCSKCFTPLRKLYDDIVPSDYPYQTHATVLINNGRWWNTFDHFCEGVGDRTVMWVGGESQDLSDFEGRGIKIDQIKVPEKNGWSMYERLRTITIKDDEVVVLSCGPMSRVLACDYYSDNPNTTVLDVGSVFDPLTRDVWFRCHIHNGKHCGGKICPEDNYTTEDERLIGKSKQDILEEIRR